LQQLRHLAWPILDGIAGGVVADSKALAIGVELEFAVEVDGGTQEMVAMELSEVIGNMRVLKHLKGLATIPT